MKKPNKAQEPMRTAVSRVLTHASRHRRAWLISDVRQKRMLIRDYSRGKDMKPMPVWARVVGAAVALVLLLAGCSALFLMRLLEVPIVVGGVTSLGLGIDILVGACSGKWPVSLQWFPFI